MKYLFILFLIPLSLLTSCSNNDDTQSNPDLPRTADDVRSDFQNLDIMPGINDFSLESTTKGFFWHFRIIAPSDASEINKKPLIFNLHGGALNLIPDAHKTTDCLVSPGIDGIIDAFVISPNSNGELWYSQNNQIQILALYDLATSYLPIDVQKTAITGFSDGGNGSWFYSQYYPSMFTAAIPMATSYNTEKSNGDLDPISIPLYVIHGENDQLFPIQTTLDYVNMSKSVGSDIQFVMASGLDHYHPCDYVSYFRDAAVWLNDTVWN